MKKRDAKLLRAAAQALGLSYRRMKRTWKEGNEAEKSRARSALLAAVNRSIERNPE
ncbi:MAG: hypothetical protein ACF8XB_20960 [Planctomycetota bacterium JB042]